MSERNSYATQQARPPVPDKAGAILQAALQLFAERGYQGTAVPLVAEAAGVAAGTIYRYFPDKEGLVNGVFQMAKQRLRDSLLRDFPVQAAPRQQFAHLWQGLVAFARNQPLAFRILELQDHVPYLDDHSRALERATLLPIWNLCAQARAAGLMADMAPEALMAMVWGAFVGLFKAELLGYIQLSDADLQQAQEACWRACVKPGQATG